MAWFLSVDGLSVHSGSFRPFTTGTELPQGVGAAGDRREKLRDRCATQDKWHATCMDKNGGIIQTSLLSLVAHDLRPSGKTANGKAINHQLVWLVLSVPDTNTPTVWATFPYMNVAWILMNSNAWTRSGCSRLINGQMAGALWVVVLSVFTFRTWVGEG